MSLLIQLLDVIMHGNTDIIVFFHDCIIILTIAPKLVGLTGMQVSATPVSVIKRRNIVWSSISMHTKYCRINCELIPANQKLAEIGIIHIIRHEATDIGCPPGNSCKSHVKSALQLVCKGLKGAGDIPGPDHITIFLGACPCTAQQIYNRLSKLTHLIIEYTAVHLGIHIADFQCRSITIAIVFKVINTVIRLRIIQPEGINSVVVVILLAYFPYIFSCFGIEGIDLHAIPLIVVGLCSTALCPDQQSFFHHRFKILALTVNRRPYGYDNLDPHRVQFIHHCLGVRPVFFVKFPITLQRPMEKVNHDLIDLNAFLLVLACYS